MGTFKIERIYLQGNGQGGIRRIIRRGLTLEQAQEHCANPETSFATCTKPHNRARTKRMGPWRDLYKAEQPSF